MADKYVCRYCGTKTASPNGNYCGNSPTKKHDFMAEKSQYVCKYCGNKTSSPNGNHCGTSPTKKHEYI